MRLYSTPDHPEHGPYLNLDPKTTTWNGVHPERSFWVGPGEWAVPDWNAITIFKASDEEGKIVGSIQLSLMVCPIPPDTKIPWSKALLRIGDWQEDGDLMKVTGPLSRKTPESGKPAPSKAAKKTAPVKGASVDDRASAKVTVDPEASPVTSSIIGMDNSPELITKAQQLGIANAARDIREGNLRILSYGSLMDPSPTFDEETGFRIQVVAGSIIGDAFLAECDAYNFAMRDHYHKHVRWKLPVAENIATTPGSYKLPNDLTLVIEEESSGRSEKGPFIGTELVWGPSYTSNPDQTHCIRLSEGQPWAVTWSADGTTLWVTCSAQLGSGKDERISRFLRVLTVREPGDVDEQTEDYDEVDETTRRRLPKAMQDLFSTKTNNATATLQGTMNDAELRQLSPTSTPTPRTSRTTRSSARIASIKSGSCWKRRIAAPKTTSA